MKYRSKPKIVEASQYIEGKQVPFGVVWDERNYPHCVPCVVTIHGHAAVVCDGDWIITEPDGEHHYPCKPDIFAASYEPAE